MEEQFHFVILYEDSLYRFKRLNNQYNAGKLFMDISIPSPISIRTVIIHGYNK